MNESIAGGASNPYPPVIGSSSYLINTTARIPGSSIRGEMWERSECQKRVRHFFKKGKRWNILLILLEYDEYFN